MAKKQAESDNDIINWEEHKKVMFNEDITTYTYEEENDKETEKLNKKSKKEKTMNKWVSQNSRTTKWRHYKIDYQVLQS